MCNWNPWRKDRRDGQKIFEEIMGENFPKFMKTLKPQIQELQ